MILPDVNLLIHAYNSDSPVHASARAWWEGLLSGTRPVGLAWVAVLGFIRIGTHRQIIEHQAELHSTDADFQRFAGLRWVNPLSST